MTFRACPRFSLAALASLALSVAGLLGTSGCAGCEDKPAPPVIAPTATPDPARRHMSHIIPPSVRVMMHDGSAPPWGDAALH